MIRNTILGLTMVTTALGQAPEWSAVEKVFGMEGTAQGDTYKLAFARSDLTVKVGTVTVEPALALTSWIAFKQIDGHTMIMGDLVLLDSEIAPVTARLIAGGVAVTALHNHIVGESPAVMYMHFDGHGAAKDLAEAIKAALSVTGTPVTQPVSAQQPTPPDWSTVESILGMTGQRKGNVVQFGIPRIETITEDGTTIPPFMGMATAINMQRVGDMAAATGDFVLVASEVNPVINVLTENGINVTALHNHMLTESPRLFFLHFWGLDEPAKLSRGLRAALNRTNSKLK